MHGFLHLRAFRSEEIRDDAVAGSPLGKESIMEAQPDILTFPSKIDLWLVVVLSVSVGAPLLVLGYRVLVVRDTKLVPPVLVLTGVTAFLCWIYATTAYRITADMLLVRCGPMRVDVPLKSVNALRASRNPLSAPALSLDRIEVSYDSKRVVISPRDRTAFVAAMKQRLPNVHLEGL
jgi:hypothetical protein